MAPGSTQSGRVGVAGPRTRVWIRPSCTMTPSWLMICRCQVTSPRRPRAWGSIDSTRVTTRIVSPKPIGLRNFHSSTWRNARVSTRGAWLARPLEIARPSNPWATGFRKGPVAAASWSTCNGLKSPEIPANWTTSASVTVRPELSHSSPGARSSRRNALMVWRGTVAPSRREGRRSVSKPGASQGRVSGRARPPPSRLPGRRGPCPAVRMGASPSRSR